MESSPAFKKLWEELIAHANKYYNYPVIAEGLSNNDANPIDLSKYSTEYPPENKKESSVATKSENKATSTNELKSQSVAYQPVKSINLDYSVPQKQAVTSKQHLKPALKTDTIGQVKSDAKLEEYKVVLGADSPIELPGPPGLLSVWIGDRKYEPNFTDKMVQATGTLPALGKTAKVTPIAPGFDVKPENSICMKIHSTGSQISFTLTPKNTGVYNVSADVLLYDSDDCSGAPIPKATQTLKVAVEVNKQQIAREHTNKMKEVFWEKLLKFWGEILGLLSLLIIFLMRRHLKKWFGFGK